MQSRSDESKYCNRLLVFRQSIPFKTFTEVHPRLSIFKNQQTETTNIFELVEEANFTGCARCSQVGRLAESR